MDKRRTQRNRVIAMSKIKQQLPLFYREELEQLQSAIADMLLSAEPLPAIDKLVAPGEWLEERHVAGKNGKPGRTYVYLRWIDDSGRERGSLVHHGTLREYVRSRL